MRVEWWKKAACWGCALVLSMTAVSPLAGMEKVQAAGSDPYVSKWGDVAVYTVDEHDTFWSIMNTIEDGNCDMEVIKGQLNAALPGYDWHFVSWITADSATDNSVEWIKINEWKNFLSNRYMTDFNLPPTERRSFYIFGTPKSAVGSCDWMADGSGNWTCYQNGVKALNAWVYGRDSQLRYLDGSGNIVTNKFQFDGRYTYYLQADGSPMKDRLTYHPDGEHLIYLDKEGHEVFTQFQYCPSVGYTCYFDSQGYLYKDQITFVGDKTYYLDGDGRMRQLGWFAFANGRDIGFAKEDGTLMDDGFGYDPWGRVVFYHWNGMVARGLITDGVTYYHMDETDGHLIGSFQK